MQPGARPAGDFWPTPQQELLLRAALLQGQPATTAWEQWQAEIDLDRLDLGSSRLLPLLYRNLHDHGVEHPWMNRFKGTYRRTWYENQLRFYRAEALLRSLHEAGMETMLLKGAALTLLHYRDLGLRPMSDFDVLVPFHRAGEAEALLRKLGWTCPYFPGEVLRDLRSFFHGAMFQESGCQVDLHWHVLHRVYPTGDDEEFWAGRVPAQIGKTATSALNPADQLLHVCLHGATYNGMPTLRWVADAAMIVRTSPGLDWDRLLEQARRHQIVLPLRQTLGYLRQTLSVEVPSVLMQTLQAQPVSRLQRRVMKWLSSHPRKRGPFLTVWSLWHAYGRLPLRVQGWRTLRALLLVSQHNNQVDRLWKVPFRIVFGWMRRIALELSRTITDEENHRLTSSCPSRYRPAATTLVPAQEAVLAGFLGSSTCRLPLALPCDEGGCFESIHAVSTEPAQRHPGDV